MLEVGLLPDEAYARFTDENGKIIAGQFKTRLDVFAAKFEDMVVRVGITDASQVEKAKLHEFGTNRVMRFEDDGEEIKVKGLPARSFIRMPLSLFLPEAIESVKIATGQGIKFNPEKVAEILGQTSVEVINDAFETQGFGQWIDHQSPQYIAHNDNPVLDKTGKMRNSIGYEVTSKETT